MSVVPTRVGMNRVFCGARRHSVGVLTRGGESLSSIPAFDSSSAKRIGDFSMLSISTVGFVVALLSRV